MKTSVRRQRRRRRHHTDDDEAHENDDEDDRRTLRVRDDGKPTTRLRMSTNLRGGGGCSRTLVARRALHHRATPPSRGRGARRVGGEGRSHRRALWGAVGGVRVALRRPHFNTITAANSTRRQSLRRHSKTRRAHAPRVQDRASNEQPTRAQKASSPTSGRRQTKVDVVVVVSGARRLGCCRSRGLPSATHFLRPPARSSRLWPSYNKPQLVENADRAAFRTVALAFSRENFQDTQV